MEFKSYIRRLILEYIVDDNDEDRKNVLVNGLKFLLKQSSELDYHELVSRLKEFIVLLYDYGFFENKNFYDLETLLDNRVPFREVEIVDSGQQLKILGEEDFFLYLSRVFHDIVMDARMRQKIYNEKKKLLEFHFNIEELLDDYNDDDDDISYEEDDDDSLLNMLDDFGDIINEFSEDKHIVNEIVAVQFISWLPDENRFSLGKFYKVERVFPYVDKRVDYDYIKEYTTDSNSWVFVIKDDRDEEKRCVLSLNDDDIAFLGKYNLE